MKIQWDESISVGVPQLDEDHKRLIGLLCYMDDHQDEHVESESISLTMEQIREFASSHFRREEEYMQSIGFPEYDAHKKAHKKFKEKTASLCVDVMNHHQETPQDIYRFLHDWVTNHILGTDKQIRAFKEARQQCENKTA